MKKPALSLIAVLGFALSLAGCFGGEDGAPTAPITPNDTNKVSARKLSPGLYVGDYSPFSADTTRRWESEFTLAADGGFRFYWVINNEPIGDIRGKWFQKDSSVHFNGITESFVNQNTGFFGPGEPVEDDTNSIRDITDSSFTRKEWTLLRQKPYWVSYKKKAFAPLYNGTFQFSRDFKIDDTTTTTIKIKISLDGTGFLYSYNEDTLESFQAQAQWYMLGSIFATESNRGRSYVDSLKKLGEWDSIPGALLQRVQQVSDTGFQMWSPGNIFAPGSWDNYRKL